MDQQLKKEFTAKWRKYFGNAELPITFYYSNQKLEVENPEAKRFHCIICDLKSVRRGKSLCIDLYTRGCHHGKLYAHLKADGLDPKLKYHMSCGIEGEMEGERYKINPGIAKETLSKHPMYKPLTRYLIFKRWDRLTIDDEPEVVVFFSRPDVLSGIIMLANFDSPEPNMAIAPLSSGCGSIISFPYQQIKSSVPLGILGMLDPSARPCVDDDILTFAVPTEKFLTMIHNMDQSFLDTPTWERLKQRFDV